MTIKTCLILTANKSMSTINYKRFFRKEILIGLSNIIFLKLQKILIFTYINYEEINNYTGSDVDEKFFISEK